MSEPRTPTMTKGERDDLLKLIRAREKTQKAAATQRSAELLADFEQQVGAIYSFDQDEIWTKVNEMGTEAISTANKVIALRCAELGIPAQFRPSLQAGWFTRSEQCASKERRAELRRMATKRIEAIEQAARVKIETASIEAQTAIYQSGLSSAAAISFLEALPAMETLMPRLDFKLIEQLTGKPAVAPSGDVVALRVVENEGAGDAE